MTALPVLKPRKCPFCAHEWYPRRRTNQNGVTRLTPRICPVCKRELPKKAA
jgi:glutaredoxin